MFCTQCGNRIPDGDKFCGKCGKPAPPPIDATPAAPPAVTVSPATVPSALPAALEASNAEPSVAAAVPSPEPVTASPPIPAEPLHIFGADSSSADASTAGPVEPASSGMGLPFWLVMFVVLAAIGACGYFVWTQMAKRASGVSVQAEPSSMHVAPGASATISAYVTGDPSGEVNWSVMEGRAGGAVRPAGAVANNGRIGAAAEYVAPLQPGTYHVLATSGKDSKQASSVEIVVP